MGIDLANNDANPHTDLMQIFYDNPLPNKTP